MALLLHLCLASLQCPACSALGYEVALTEVGLTEPGTGNAAAFAEASKLGGWFEQDFSKDRRPQQQRHIIFYQTYMVATATTFIIFQKARPPSINMDYILFKNSGPSSNTIDHILSNPEAQTATMFIVFVSKSLRPKQRHHIIF